MKQNQYFVGIPLQNKTKAGSQKKGKKNTVTSKREDTKKMVSPESAYFTALQKAYENRKGSSTLKVIHRSQSKKSTSLKSGMVAVHQTQNLKSGQFQKSATRNPQGRNQKSPPKIDFTKVCYKQSKKLRAKYRFGSPDSSKSCWRTCNPKTTHRSLPKEQSPRPKLKSSSKLTLQIFHNKVIRDVRNSSRQRDIVSGSLERQGNSELHSSKRSDACDFETQTQTHQKKLNFHHLQSIKISPIKQQRAKDVVHLMQEKYQNEKMNNLKENWEEVERKYLMLNKNQDYNEGQGISTNLHSVLAYIGKIQEYTSQNAEILFKKFNMQNYKTILQRMEEIQLNQGDILPQKVTVFPQFIISELEETEKVRMNSYRYQYFHDRCIFDCINQLLANILTEQEHYCWQFAAIHKDIQPIKIFSQLRSEITEIVSTLDGLYASQKNESSDFAKTLILKNWQPSLSDRTLQITIQITDLLFEELVDDFLFFLSS